MNKKTLEDLLKLFNECQKPDLDGYTSKPILKSTLSYSIAFLASLPAKIEPPSVDVETDGSVSFEWYKSQENLIYVNIDSNGKVFWLTKPGNKKQYGKIKDKALEKLFNLIRKIEKEER